MKCINCGKKTEEGKIVCEGCINLEECSRFFEVRRCRSFVQIEGEKKGVCQHVLSCTPIKKALMREPFIAPLGHVICPYSETNLRYVLYGTFNKENLKNNYSECFE